LKSTCVAIVAFLQLFEVAGAQTDEARIKQGVELIKLGCGTGVSSQKFEIKGGTSGSLTLKRLPGAEGHGDITYSKEEATGLAEALQDEITSESVHLSEKQIDCMKPRIDRIFDVLFPPPKAGAGNKAPTYSITAPNNQGIVTQNNTIVNPPLPHLPNGLYQGDIQIGKAQNPRIDEARDTIYFDAMSFTDYPDPSAPIQFQNLLLQCDAIPRKDPTVFVGQLAWTIAGTQCKVVKSRP
jgi:hypothetical protein